MKTITKILILLAVLILAVGAVMIFRSTIASPPETSKQIDVYIDNLNECVGEFNTYRTKEEMDTPFKTTMERIKIFNDEKKITSEFAEDRLCDMTGRYVPLFLKYWDARFSKDWDYEAIKSYSDQKSELSRLRHFSDDREVLSEYLTAEFSKLDDIIPNWKEVIDLYNNNSSYSYSTYNNAKSRSDKIKEKKNDAYLKHCRYVLSLLEGSLKSMEESHYSYVSSLVDKLNNFILPNSKRADYDALYSVASKAINEYKEYAKELYGSENDGIASLIQKFNTKNKAAQQYYGGISGVSNVRVDVKDPYTTSSQQRLKIKRVRLTDTETIIDFEYVSGAGGWCNIDPSTYIKANDRTYKMIRAEWIPLMPEKHYFSFNGESLLFTLIFPALPNGVTQFDLIESSTSSWKFNGVKLTGNGSSYSSGYKTGYIAGHEYVDLGLSVKWAKCNVSAPMTYDYGNYYAWGETTTKSDYTENSVSYSVKSRNTDISGNSQFDVASWLWGSSWRMPSKAEMEELVNKCKWVWTTQGGNPGYKITGPNGNSIFLPAAGGKSGRRVDGAKLYGYYWCSIPYTGGKAYCLRFSYVNSYFVTQNSKYYGCSIRPVSK